MTQPATWKRLYIGLGALRYVKKLQVDFDLSISRSGHDIDEIV
jgi:hypothetical protein